MWPYIGGKANHAGWLDTIFPTGGYNTYVEVFGGAGWVGLKSNKIVGVNHHVYNDYNRWIANIWECLRSDPSKLLDTMNRYPTSDRDLYRQFQTEIFGGNLTVNQLGDFELAAKYLYLQTQLFSGVTLGLNSPIYFQDVASGGKYSSKWNNLRNKLCDPKWLDRLARVDSVENVDCIELIQKWDSPTTFFYLDPPYWGKEYLYTCPFPVTKHRELWEVLDHCSGRWCLSYYDFPELREWCGDRGWRWWSKSVFRWSSTRAHRDPEYATKARGTEIAITNYDPLFLFSL